MDMKITHSLEEPRELENYIGTKIIKACKMDLKTFKEKIKGDINTAYDPTTDGYMVKYEDGYTSWSPAAAFEKAYRKLDGKTKDFILA